MSKPHRENYRPTVKEEPGDVVLWNHHKCNRCRYQTKSLDIMRQHLRQHKNPRKFLCTECTPDKYKCKICFYSVNTLVNYNTHMKNAHSKPPKSCGKNSFTKYTCGACQFRTFSQLMYISHLEGCNVQKVVKFMRKPPSKTKPSRVQFRCSYCLYTTPCQKTLKRHMRSAECEVSETFRCKLCTVLSKNVNDLKKHVKEVHMSMGLFKCNSCSFKALRVPTLMSHITKAHCQYKCDMCSFVCVGSVVLKEHVMIKHIAPDNMEAQRCVLCGDQMLNFTYRNKIVDLCGCSDDVWWV